MSDHVEKPQAKWRMLTPELHPHISGFCFPLPKSQLGTGSDHLVDGFERSIH